MQNCTDVSHDLNNFNSIEICEGLLLQNYNKYDQDTLTLSNDDLQIESLKSIVDKNNQRNESLKENLTQLAKCAKSIQQTINNIIMINDNSILKVDEDKVNDQLIDSVKQEFESKLMKLMNDSHHILSPSIQTPNLYVSKTLIERITAQKMIMHDKLDQFKNRIFQLEKIIQEKDDRIKKLEGSFNIDDEVGQYERKISNLEQKLDFEKLRKSESGNYIMNELKKQLDVKISQTLQLTKENIQCKDTIRRMVTENELTNQRITKLEQEQNNKKNDNELNQRIATLIDENNNLTQRNTFQNQSIRELLRRIKELQMQVKSIEMKSATHFRNFQPSTMRTLSSSMTNNDDATSSFNMTPYDGSNSLKAIIESITDQSKIDKIRPSYFSMNSNLNSKFSPDFNSPLDGLKENTMKTEEVVVENQNH